MEYLFTFLEGIASFISPCVLPMVPIYISYFAGKDEKKNKALLNSVGFVLGFSIVFILMGILVNKAGLILSNIIDGIKVFFGILIIILGIGYMGLFELSFLNKIKRFNVNTENLNFVKSIIFGMLFSISMTPCVGAFLASALLLIASSTTLLKGISLIIAYCIGLGIPFIISAVLIDRLKVVFGFIKNNYKIIKILSGVILIFMGIYLIFIAR